MPTPVVDVAGRLEVPERGSFTIEVQVVDDVPLWTVELGGSGVQMTIGKDASPFSRTVSGLANGFYMLTIVATLSSDQGRFVLIAKSDIDDERKELVKLPDAAKRYDMMPVVVGLGA
jgi:hypothetical protein